MTMKVMAQVTRTAHGKEGWHEKFERFDASESEKGYVFLP